MQYIQNVIFFLPAFYTDVLRRRPVRSPTFARASMVQNGLDNVSRSFSLSMWDFDVTETTNCCFMLQSPFAERSISCPAFGLNSRSQRNVFTVHGTCTWLVDVSAAKGALRDRSDRAGADSAARSFPSFPSFTVLLVRRVRLVPSRLWLSRRQACVGQARAAGEVCYGTWSQSCIGCGISHPRYYEFENVKKLRQKLKITNSYPWKAWKA